jgi:predicted Zn-dependent protease
VRIFRVTHPSPVCRIQNMEARSSKRRIGAGVRPT